MAGACYKECRGEVFSRRARIRTRGNCSRRAALHCMAAARPDFSARPTNTSMIATAIVGMRKRTLIAHSVLHRIVWKHLPMRLDCLGVRGRYPSQ